MPKVENFTQIFPSAKPTTLCLLICTLISENQGLEKSRSASNLRKISGPANLDLYHKREKNPGDKLKIIQVCRT